MAAASPALAAQADRATPTPISTAAGLQLGPNADKAKKHPATKIARG
jgi:hypothetical protein